MVNRTTEKLRKLIHLYIVTPLFSCEVFPRHDLKKTLIVTRSVGLKLITYNMIINNNPIDAIHSLKKERKKDR
jgi:hypothetical protein